MSLTPTEYDRGFNDGMASGLPRSALENANATIEALTAEITKLTSQLEEARARIEELEDAPKGLDTGEWASRIENYFILASCGRRDGKSPFELVDADVGLIGMQARAKVIEECARIADEYEGEGLDGKFMREGGDGVRTKLDIAKSIRALLSESKS